MGVHDTHPTEPLWIRPTDQEYSSRIRIDFKVITYGFKVWTRVSQSAAAHTIWEGNPASWTSFTGKFASYSFAIDTMC